MIQLLTHLGCLIIGLVSLGRVSLARAQFIEEDVESEVPVRPVR